MKKLLWLAIPLILVGGAAGVLLLLVLSGRVSMSVPERLMAWVREKLQKPLHNLRELKFILLGKNDPNKGVPEYYDLY